MKHMTLSEIADACCGIYCGDPAFLDCEVSSVAIDSRKVVKGMLPKNRLCLLYTSDAADE